MADYHFGGSEEENAELRKLETELVRLKRGYPYHMSLIVTDTSHRSMTLTISKPGRSLSAVPRPSRVA
jgi:hypothetical protein